MRVTSVVSLSAISLPAVMAWGSMGHQTVALIAEHLLTSQAKSWVKSILGDVTMTQAATWPDEWRKLPGNGWSAPLHYIDAKDEPPHQCGVNLDRDCGPEGCVVSAIANYTTRVQDTKLSADQRADAMKFVIHFIGDIAQPLHVENIALGGNQINVTFDGVKTNLHAVWDTSIPEKIAGNSTLAHADAWAKTLCGKLYASEFGNFRQGYDRSWNCADVSSSDGAKKCAMTWALDTNKWNCKDVFVPTINDVTDHELGGEYFQRSAKIVDGQIARAGYRLAIWLNAMARRASYH